MKHLLSHKNPDTDSILSGIAYARLLNKLGENAKSFALGEPNNETKYILNTFNVKTPEIISSLPKDSKVILMDHNEVGQAIDNLDELNLVGIIDHHKFVLKTETPLFIRSEPIGSTCSIVTKLFNEANVEIDKSTAQILISAIISDTLFFRSPTTTDEDKKLVEQLNKVAQIEDLEALSLELFNAKSDLGDITVKDMIQLDYKKFNFGGDDYTIGVMETTNPNFGLNKKDEILKVLEEIKEENNLKGVFFSIIDILNEQNYTLTSGEEETELLKDIFGVEVEDDVAHLGNIISRKKQLVPKFEDYFNN